MRAGDTTASGTPIRDPRAQTASIDETRETRPTRADSREYSQRRGFDCSLGEGSMSAVAASNIATPEV